MNNELVVKRVFYVLKKSNLVDESSFKGAFLLPCYNMPTHKNIIFPFYVYLSWTRFIWVGNEEPSDITFIDCKLTNLQ